MVENKLDDATFGSKYLECDWHASTINDGFQHAEDVSTSVSVSVADGKRNRLRGRFMMCMCAIVCVCLVLNRVLLRDATMEHRTLHIATCYADKNGYDPPELWVKGAHAVKPTETLSVKVVNVCEGLLSYTDNMLKFYWMDKYLAKIAHSVPNDLVLFTDSSDVLINAIGLTTHDFEHRFDTARGSASILIMAEPWCFFGWVPSKEEGANWYPEVADLPPKCEKFLNSGGIAGSVSSMREFYSVAIGLYENVKLQFIDKGLAKVKKKKDDQGLSAYVHKLYPSWVQLDYRGLLFSGVRDLFMCSEKCTCMHNGRTSFIVDTDGIIRRNSSDSRVASHMRECAKDVRPLVIHGFGLCKDSFFAIVKEVRDRGVWKLRKK